MTRLFKRRGPMVFWRLGRIGGSFYIASNASGTAPKRRERKPHDRTPPAQQAPQRPARAGRAA